MPEGIAEGILRIVIGLVALLAGWAIGFFDSRIRADKKIKEAEAKSERAIQQAKGEAERAAAQAARTAAASTPLIQPGRTFLRLWLDSAEQPALDLDSRPVSTSPISEPDRKRLLTLLTVMRPWIEGKPAAPIAAAQSLSPTPAPRIVPSSTAPAPTPPSVKKDEKPAASLSIVGQIDEILQMRLASTALAGHSIRLQESPEGGVIVWVGMQKFAGVGDVTDPEVQAIIRAAIAEWENKYTPGL